MKTKTKIKSRSPTKNWQLVNLGLKKQKENFVQKTKKRILVIILIATLSLQSLSGFFVFAAPSQDNTTGSWTDSFSDSTGFSSQTDTEVLSGNVQLESETPGMWTETSQSDFESGTSTQLDTTSSPGSLKLDGQNYSESLIANEFIGGGVAQGWNDDEAGWNYSLPFTFPYYGTNYNSIWVISNGYIHLDSNYVDYEPSEAKLKSNKIIAPLWEDLLTDGAAQPGEDIYIHQPNANSVCIRWVAETYWTSELRNFEVILYNDGTIKSNYGSDNINLPSSGFIIGASKGDNDKYCLSTYNSASNLTNTQTAQYTYYPNYFSSGTYTSSQYNANSSTGSKTFEDLTINTQALPVNTSIQLQYSIDGGIYQNLGTYNTPGATTQTYNFPGGTSGNNIQYKAILSTSTPASTPTLNDITINYNYSSGNWTQTSQSDFSSGTVNQIDTGISPGNIQLAHNGYTENLISNEFIGAGTGKSWWADDQSWYYDLPFEFSYYGINYSSIWVNSNGYIHFESDYNNSGASVSDLKTNKMIAPLWQDLLTNGTAQANEDIYIHQPSVDSVCFRWCAESLNTGLPVNFELILYQNGDIKFNYNGGNASISSTVVGISRGDNTNYLLSTYHNPANLTNVQTSKISYSSSRYTTGTFTSEDYDAGDATQNKLFSNIAWNKTTPPGTSISLQYMLDNSGIWSAADTTGTITFPADTTAKIIKYRVNLTGDGTATPLFQDASISYIAYPSSGIAITSNITPTAVAQWGTLTFNKTTPTYTDLTVDVLNSSNNLIVGYDDVSSGVGLSGINPATYPTIRFRANLSTTNNAYTSSLEDWTVTWDPNAPSVNNISPTSGTVSGNTNITWSAIDPDPADRGLIPNPITIYYSKNNGTTWFELANNLANSGTYSWNTTLDADSATYRIKIVATDGFGAQGEATSGTFAIDNYVGPPGIAPTVNLTSPTGGETWSETQSITWNAIDVDFVANPINIYYSTNDVTWNQIATSLANTGNYSWDTTTVSDSTNYKVKVVGLDQTALTSEDTSGSTFTIDNGPPSFAISYSADPAPAGGITVTINASEDLIGAPTVTITQNGGPATPVAMSGSGSIYSGTYTVTGGFDGTATTTCSGTDLFGNPGSTITSGATFEVDTVTPGDPTITSPTDGQIFSSSPISVSGTGDASENIRLTINGTTEYTTFISGGGLWTVGGVVLDPAFNNGNNTIQAESYDDAGNTSSAVSITVKLNTAPTITLTYPTGGETIGNILPITWNASDTNGDSMTYSVQYSSDGGTNFEYLTTNLTDKFYNWNTTSYSDGRNYVIKVSTSDGTDISSDTSGAFTIDNYQPGITINPLGKNPTNDSTPTFTGRALSSDAKIQNVQFTLNDGIDWYNTQAQDGSFNASEEYYTLTTSWLSDGNYTIKTRAYDSNGGWTDPSAYASYNFTIDTAAPARPNISSPPYGATLSSGDDQNPNIDGTQITVSGTAEAQSIIKVYLEGNTFEGSTSGWGVFYVYNVTISHGENNLRVTATDPAGNESSSTYHKLIMNNAPNVTVISPNGGEFWSSNKEVSWTASDSEGDPMTFSIQYSASGGAGWSTIASGLSSYSLSWDTSSLSESGNYLIKVIAKDSWGEGSDTSNSTFTIDNTSPTITLNEYKPDPTSEVRPIFTGIASDNLAGLEYIEYSLNGGDWYKAIITNGYRTTKAEFRFKYPLDLPEEINYIQTRGTDRAENIGLSNTIDLTIDTTPPSIGANMIKLKNQVLFPDQNGEIEVPPGSTVNLTVAITGEPETAFIEIKNEKIDLEYSKTTGLYIQEINLKEEGKWPLFVTASDKLKNIRSREIAIFKVPAYGKIYNKKDDSSVKNAEVSIYLFDKTMDAWNMWDGDAYYQSNPIVSDENGNYIFTLPSGEYYFKVEAEGFYHHKSKKFKVEKNKLVNFDIGLSPATIITLPTHLLGLPKIILTLRQFLGSSGLLLIFILGIVIIIKRHNYNHRLNHRRGEHENLGIH